MLYKHIRCSTLRYQYPVFPNRLSYTLSMFISLGPVSVSIISSISGVFRSNLLSSMYFPIPTESRTLSIFISTNAMSISQTLSSCSLFISIVSCLREPFLICFTVRHQFPLRLLLYHFLSYYVCVFRQELYHSVGYFQIHCFS
uniref:Uncharacterized protein n=1 Tax=Cacopsylla melanoneura TaxID=428564 RepID=A0A8D9E993_9HEMI